MLRIKAEPVKGKDLKPGELFSVLGPEYWDDFAIKGSIGEKVYVRTDTPLFTKAGEEDTVYRLTVEVK